MHIIRMFLFLSLASAAIRTDGPTQRLFIWVGNVSGIICGIHERRIRGVGRWGKARFMVLADGLAVCCLCLASVISHVGSSPLLLPLQAVRSVVLSLALISVLHKVSKKLQKCGSGVGVVGGSRIKGKAKVTLLLVATGDDERRMNEYVICIRTTGRTDE